MFGINGSSCTYLGISGKYSASLFRSPLRKFLFSISIFYTLVSLFISILHVICIHIRENVHMHKHYMEWLFQELGFCKMHDWYSLSLENIVTNYGGGLLKRKYHNDVIELLRTTYPEHLWNRQTFTSSAQTDSPCIRT